MIQQNKILLLLIGPIAGVAVYLIGDNVVQSAPDSISQIVASSRDWLFIIGGVYVVNYIIAWLFRFSWPVTLGRTLVSGLFAYICIAELIDLIGSSWSFIGQIMGATGPIPQEVVNGTRYALVAWGVSLMMTIICIGIGFEVTPNEDEHSTGE